MYHIKIHTYIDHLLAINNDGILNNYKNRIYPPELTLNCKDKSDQEVNYLDLHLEVKDSSIHYRLFDKRDNFSFDTVNFPDLSGYVPTNQSYGVYFTAGTFCTVLSEICRFYISNFIFSRKVTQTSF